MEIIIMLEWNLSCALVVFLEGLGIAHVMICISGLEETVICLQIGQKTDPILGLYTCIL